MCEQMQRTMSVGGLSDTPKPITTGIEACTKTMQVSNYSAYDIAIGSNSKYVWYVIPANTYMTMPVESGYFSAWILGGFDNKQDIKLSVTDAILPIGQGALTPLPDSVTGNDMLRSLGAFQILQGAQGDTRKVLEFDLSSGNYSKGFIEIASRVNNAAPVSDA